MSLITRGGEGTVGAATIEVREVGIGGGVVVVSRDSAVAVLTVETKQDVVRGRMGWVLNQ